MTLIDNICLLQKLQFSLTNILYNYSILLVRFSKYFVINYTLILYFLNSFGFSILPGLANPIGTIHPILLLLCLPILFNRSKVVWLCIIILWFSLVLGGWWASQEFNWGGWWNWDLIESPILAYTIILVYYNHSKYLNSSTTQHTYNTISLVLVVILILLNTRYLSTGSIHSFIQGSYVIEYWSLLFLRNLHYIFIYTLSLTNIDSVFILKFFLLYILTLFNYSGGIQKFKILKLHTFLKYSISGLFYLNFLDQFNHRRLVSSASINNLSYGNSYHNLNNSAVVSWLKEISVTV